MALAAALLDERRGRGVEDSGERRDEQADLVRAHQRPKCACPGVPLYILPSPTGYVTKAMATRAIGWQAAVRAIGGVAHTW